MEKTQKIIVVLLIVAILFSAMSILFSLSNNDVDNTSVARGNQNFGGNVALVINPQETLDETGGENGGE